MAFQQMQQEASVLKYPEDFGLHPNVSLENAANMLFRAIQSSHNQPYAWTFIDKPVAEVKFDSQDTAAWRYCLHKGSHPQLVLIHHSRVPPIEIDPSLMNYPVRHYLLLQITDPPIYVMGERAGQKDFPHLAVMSVSRWYTPSRNEPAGDDSAVEQRRERERMRDGSGGVGVDQRPGHPRLNDDESAAITRYRRNHELMEEVFRHAAFAKKPSSSKRICQGFDKAELEAKSAKLQDDVGTLQAKAAELEGSESNGGRRDSYS
ncbi:hypothetical protein DFJ58DRAFT_844555 [Suillus subalutaceus]|uniref:uncharacterized protein n=1 Tax=Suillus subalutaceus TaxID=48586 RepID=UPI001B86BF4A|nr:uncharacterized protein DFJ58DRAFT_844555 [Suillus subalutaceus]KAG1842737.1 hypothetical protein DFJ58DRAFT_844555 [Suillus subalutaceus]